MKIFLLALVISTPAWCAEVEQPWVSMGADGRLKYHADAQGNCIPDFSRAGYGTGNCPLPDVPVRLTLEPESGDQTKRIQDALDTLAKMPLATGGRKSSRRITSATAGARRTASSGIARLRNCSSSKARPGRTIGRSDVRLALSVRAGQSAERKKALANSNRRTSLSPSAAFTKPNSQNGCALTARQLRVRGNIYEPLPDSETINGHQCV